jgi:SAM-dependent methyltransferase
MNTTHEHGRAAAEYDRLAPYYDAFTAGYAYEPWIDAIERRAIAFGLRGLRALDLACGTGASSGPLIARGYTLTACDISPGMVAEARRKFPALADRFVVADMRELPALGRFDLVLCLDDAVNYLLTEGELDATFRGVARMLSPSAVFAFDVNSLHTYRTAFAQAMVRGDERLLMAWLGETPPDVDAGSIGSAAVEIFSQRADGLWERTAMRHVQRHHPPEVIIAALARAGLECTIAGQHPGARLENEFDDERHIKGVYLARPTADCSDPAAAGLL